MFAFCCEKAGTPAKRANANNVFFMFVNKKM